MTRELFLWLGSFIMGFLLHGYDLVDQGTAFICIYIGGFVVLVLIRGAVCFVKADEVFDKIAVSVDAMALGAALFIAFVANLMFGKEFTITFQCLTLGMALFGFKQKKCR